MPFLHRQRNQTLLELGWVLGSIQSNPIGWGIQIPSEEMIRVMIQPLDFQPKQPLSGLEEAVLIGCVIKGMAIELLVVFIFTCKFATKIHAAMTM